MTARIVNDLDETNDVIMVAFFHYRDFVADSGQGGIGTFSAVSSWKPLSIRHSFDDLDSLYDGTISTLSLTL